MAITDLGPARPWRAAPLRVVDLTALWAGPLCTQALVRAGAEVTRVESAGRPDASRSGSPGLFAALDQGKAHVVVDLATGDGVAELRALLVEADVVVSASRPRALEQLGITATNLLANDDGPQVWTSITGHGRRSARVAFGDDAAVAGGLVAWEDGEPSFVGDALADPLAGLAAAAATLEALAAGRRALVDVSMAGVAATAGADAGVGAAQT
ncbi:MAG: CoA transferase [Acidimicrobiales bacterium]